MRRVVGSLAAAALAVSTSSGTLSAQAIADTVNAHVAAARAAAGDEHAGLFNRVCAEPTPAPERSPTAAARPQGPPDRSQWHAEPAKVFDNLYFVGQTEYSAWALTTSDGIILIDTIFDYSVEDEVVGGLKKLGLDPSRIKYAIVSHGHLDHSGGAKYLQDHFGTRVILSAADWDLLDRSSGTRPKRDMVATDGQKLTLGDTTITLYVTPGHTLGTLSTLIPVKDKGTPHLAAEWGGTAFNWVQNRAAYITPDRPDTFWFESYIKSAERFKDIAARAGADVLIANHTEFDGSKRKLPALAIRKSSDVNPYVIGKESVQRYLTVAEECARAGLLRVTPGRP